MKRLLLSLFLIIAIVKIGVCQTPSAGENLKIDWPDEYKWKIGSNQENETMHMVELVPGDETIDNWKTIGTMISYKGVKGVDINNVPQLIFAPYQKDSPESKLTVFEKDDKAKHPWIIFKIETPAHANYPQPESDLYYVTQGDQALYSNFVGIKTLTIPDDFVKKWITVFKAAEIVNN